MVQTPLLAVPIALSLRKTLLALAKVTSPPMNPVARLFLRNCIGVGLVLTTLAPRVAVSQNRTTSQARVSLLRADSVLRAAVGTRGLGELVSVLAVDGVLLYGGAPVVTGRANVGRLLRAQPILDSLVISWDPSQVWMSAERDMGVVYGLAAITPRTAAAPSREGTIIAVWERATAWRLVGLMVNGIAPPDQTRLAREIAPLRNPLVMAREGAQAMVQADMDFAAMAGRSTAAAAFEAYAAPNAIMIGGAPPRNGPVAIGAALASGAPAMWQWHPVFVRASARGDLGFTVGEAVIAPVDTTQAASYSKYLTVWAREADGRVRFLTDGGNSRPRP